MSGSQSCPAVRPRSLAGQRVLILPYDGSAAARAALRHARERLRFLHGGRLVLLLPRRPRCALLRRRGRLQRQAVLDAESGVRVLGDDLPAALERLAQCQPAPTFVVTLEQRGTSRWYRDVAGDLLSGRYGRCLALHLPPASAEQVATHHGAPAASPVAAAR